MGRLPTKNIIVATALLVLGLVFLLIWLSQPSMGHIKYVTSLKADSAPKPEQTKVSGVSANFQIPAGYQVNSLPKNPSNPESYRYVEKKPGGALLTIGIKPWDKAITEDSAVRYRQINPDTYLKSTLTLDGGEAIKYSLKAETFEEVVLSTNSGRLATIALSGGGDGQEYAKQLGDLVSSWHWK